MQIKHIKKIGVVSGNRADYGILKILIQKIKESKKLELIVYITGIHLLKKFGNTIDLIIKDSFSNIRIIQIYKDNLALGIIIGRAIIDFTTKFLEDKPDMIVVLGDRFEILVSVIAATSLNIPIVHIHGGDHNFQGQIDETIRHVISKFAHVHFPATEKSAERLRKMGEEDWRIHMVGSPAIDMIVSEKLLNKEQICKKLGLDSSNKVIVCVFHSYIPEHERAGRQMNAIINALKCFMYQKVIVYPNNDLGSELIINEIEQIIDDDFKIFRNLDRVDYLSLLKNSDLMAGNSSSGIIDSSIFKIPVVNIGKRNFGRESAKNVINCSFKNMFKSILKGLSPEFRNVCRKIKNPYGDGRASEKIINDLECLEINDKLLKKRFVL